MDTNISADFINLLMHAGVVSPIIQGAFVAKFVDAYGKLEKALKNQPGKPQMPLIVSSTTFEIRS